MMPRSAPTVTVRFAAAMLLALASLPLLAAPRVVVSVAPLHSLVTELMAGVAKPKLLMMGDGPATQKPDVAQQLELITADAVLWVGPEWEKGLAKSLPQLPRAGQHAFAVTKFIPLLDARDGRGRDPRFWLDPRLAIAAVHQIAPRLARLDPDNLERYLDNEIRLVKRLKKLERDMQARFAPFAGQRVALAGGASAYLARRMGVAPVPPSAPGLIAVALTNKTKGVAQEANGHGLAVGGGLYFELMARDAEALLSDVRERALTAGLTAEGAVGAQG